DEPSGAKQNASDAGKLPDKEEEEASDNSQGNALDTPNARADKPASERDEVSKQWLNGRMHVSVLGEDRQPTEEERRLVTALAPAPDGAHSTIDTSNLPFFYRVETVHPFYKKP